MTLAARRLIARALCLTLPLLACKGRQPAPKPALTAHLQRTFTGPSEMIWEVAFSPDGQYLASGSVDRTVMLWRLRRRE